jgi:peptidoglycan/LPS O-acetylase OafA/YrhL
MLSEPSAMQRSTTSRLYNLDLLRLVSAVSVLVFHYGFRMAISGEGGGVGFPELAPVAMWLDVGLLVFFVISGYVIALSAQERTAWDFAVGRFARLWPTFVICATITTLVLVAWPVPGIPAPTLQQWLAQFIMISRLVGQPFMDGAYWTIAYEIFFYGWVFVLLAAGWFRDGWRIAVVGWLAISAANELLFHSGAVTKLLITEYSGFFAYGLVLFHAQRQFDRRAAALLALALAWAVASTFVVEPRMVEQYGVHRAAWGVGLTGIVATGLVTLAALLPALPIRPALAYALGALTYPLYLLHQHIGYAVFTRFGAQLDRWALAALLIAALLCAAWLIAALVEPPARRWIVATGARLRPAMALRGTA